MISTELSSASFIDIDDNSKLLIIDLTGDSSINLLSKESVNSSGYYEIVSNQNIEMYGEPIVGVLYSVEIFAKGTGTIELFINDTSVGSVTVNSPTRYSSYRIRMRSEMNMLNYKFKISKDVKIMQRVIGTVNMMESYNG